MSGPLRWLPLAQTLGGYRREWLLPDLVAGLSICVVMVPSVVAYAGLAGLPPVVGLYAALAALIGYGVLASSRQVIAGPDAAITLLVGVAIAPLVAREPERAPVLAAAIATFAGLILLLTAVLRAGIVADLLSKPVLVGYMTGAALILISTQLGKFVGVEVEAVDFFDILRELWQRHPEFHGLTTWLGLSLVAIQVGIRTFMPRVPVALAVFVLGILFASVQDLGARGVALVGEVPSGLPAPSVPWIRLSDLHDLIPGAFAVALLTVPEGILLARAFAAKNGYEIEPNREIAALGAGNILAGFFQGFSIGASQSRTAVNDAAGGRTALAGIFAAGGLVLFLLFLTPLLAMLPKVALAAILIFAGVGLIEIRQYRELARFDLRSAALAVLVMLGVLVAGVLQGILIGVVLSLIHVILGMVRPMEAVLRPIPGTRSYHDLGDDGPETGETAPGVIAYRVYAPLMFANAAWFAGRIRSLVSNAPSKVRCFVLDVQAMPQIDATAHDALRQVAQELAAQGIEFKIARANRPLREQLAATGLLEIIGEQNLAPSVHAAVHDALARAATSAAMKEAASDAPSHRASDASAGA